MAFRVKEINCGHRRFGQGEKAVNVFYVTDDGRRYPTGQICKECVVTAGIEGLSRWMWLYTNQALSWQPRLGEVQIVFDGIGALYSDEDRRKLMARLEADLEISARLKYWLNKRDCVEALPSSELLRRITFRV